MAVILMALTSDARGSGVCGVVAYGTEGSGCKKPLVTGVSTPATIGSELSHPPGMNTCSQTRMAAQRAKAWSDVEVPQQESARTFSWCREGDLNPHG